MKSTILLILFIFFQLSAFSQPAIEWQKCYGGTGTEQAASIRQTADGGYIVAGYTASNDSDVSGYHGAGPYYGDCWIVKLNDGGAIEWQKCLGGTNDEMSSDIQQTADGGYILAAYSWSNDGDVTGNHGGGDCWIVKLNSIGGIQWQKCFGGTGNDAPASIQQTKDGGYIFAGINSSCCDDVTGHHGNPQIEDYWVVKLDSTGTMQWQKSLGGTDHDIAYAVQQTTDSGYIVAGYSLSRDGDVSNSYWVIECWIVKLSGSGAILWQKCFGGTDGATASSIQQTTDGGYIVGGYSYSKDGDLTFNHGDLDCWVFKITAGGAIQWQISLGGTMYDKAYSIRQTMDGGYVVAGLTRSNDDDVSGNHGTADDWIVQLDSSGTIQWQKCLGGTGNDYAYSIRQTTDKGFIVAGYGTSNDYDVSGNHGGWDYWVVKLAPVISEIKEINFDESQLMIYPNPSSDRFLISFGKGINNGALKIYDLLGKEIYSEPFSDASFKTKEITFHAPKGIYYVQVRSGEKMWMRKIVKE